MMERMKSCVALLLLLALPLAAQAEELVTEFKGSRSTSTLEFEVKAPWIMDWRLSGDGNQVSAVDVSLFDAGTGVHEGMVLRRKMPGNGVRMFDQSGRFYFRIDATLMEWTLKVIQLTEEEARAYTPKSNHPLDK
jgi:hypothetical protein